MLQDRVNKKKRAILIQTIFLFVVGGYFVIQLTKAATVQITIYTLPMVIEQMFANIQSDPFAIK